MIHPLSEEFNRWLSTILLFFRHVKIIDEDNESLSWWRSIDTFSSLIELLIKCVLGLVR